MTQDLVSKENHFCLKFLVIFNVELADFEWRNKDSSTAVPPQKELQLKVSRNSFGLHK